jgi:hypothetical protein
VHELVAPIFHEEIVAVTAPTSTQCQLSGEALATSFQSFQASPPNSTANQSSSAENAPQYKQDRSVKELWDEWHHGRDGKLNSMTDFAPNGGSPIRPFTVGACS